MPCHRKYFFVSCNLKIKFWAKYLYSTLEQKQLAFRRTFSNFNFASRLTQAANRYSASCLNSKNGSQLPVFQLSFSLPGCNSQMLTGDNTQFSVLVLTHIAEPAAFRSAEVRLQSSPKCAANIGIANMRAGRKINRRQLYIQLHRLVGRSKKPQRNKSRFIFIKKHLPGVTEFYYPHISNTFSL